MVHAVASLPLQESEDIVSDEAFFDPFAGLLGQNTPSDDLWLGKAAPRYTSYPPATAFQEDLTTENYRGVLEGLSPEEPISLYVHIPFCQKLCLYCGCHTSPTQQHDPVDRYLHTVHRELENLATMSPRSRRISHLHFGGGSPNIMSEKDLGLMIGAMARRFDLSSTQEIAMELDPRLITKAQARVLGMAGITRVSLGIQDFDEDVQEAIGRVHSFEQIAKSCYLLREAGIEKINFDLMYGLPKQSPLSVAKTARLASGLTPDRIALFPYAHMPHVKKHQKVLEQFVLPGPHAALAMERAARAILREDGFIEIGMDHFARPSDSLTKAKETGKLRRNFQGYTDDTASTLLGVGASSISQTTDFYFQNACDIDDYAQHISKHGLATTRGLHLSSEDKFRADIIQELMCTLSVNLEKICTKNNFSVSTLAESLEALEPFEKAGLIQRDGYKIKLLTAHRMAVRVIASVFDTTQHDDKTPVSRTV